jgi:hypothetical protein
MTTCILFAPACHIITILKTKLITMKTSWNTRTTIDHSMVNNSVQVTIFALCANLNFTRHVNLNRNSFCLLCIMIWTQRLDHLVIASKNVSFNILKCSIDFLFSWFINKNGYTMTLIMVFIMENNDHKKFL